MEKKKARKILCWDRVKTRISIFCGNNFHLVSELRAFELFFHSSSLAVFFLQFFWPKQQHLGLHFFWRRKSALRNRLFTQTVALLLARRKKEPKKLLEMYQKNEEIIKCLFNRSWKNNKRRKQEHKICCYNICFPMSFFFPNEKWYLACKQVLRWLPFAASRTPHMLSTIAVSPILRRFQ